MLVTIPCAACGTLNRTDLDRLARRPRCGSCRAALDLTHPVAVDAGSFDAVLAGSEAPVLVDFYADWCGPCRIVAPAVDALAQARAGSVLVLKVDTDKSPGLSERLGIRGIPTLIAFRHGVETGRHVGVAQRPQLDALVGAA
jgi:thioredoxin 2